MECHLPGFPTQMLANATHKAMVRPLAASNAAHQPGEAPKWLTSQGKEKTQKIKTSVKILTKTKGKEGAIPEGFIG